MEEYTHYLLENLFVLDQKNEYILFLSSWKKSKVDFSWIGKYSNASVKKLCFPNKLLNLMFWYLGWPKIDQLVGGVDIFFSPNIIFGKVGAKTKSVVTIHDLSFLRFPAFFTVKMRCWHKFIGLKGMLKKADKIVAVSENTRNDIINLLEKINKFGTTVILVTHNKEIVNSLRRRVVTIDAGRVISDQKIGKYIL